MAEFTEFDTLTTPPIDEGLKALVKTIQLALFSDNLSQLGQTLDGIYRQMWEAIVSGVKTEGEQSL